MLEGLAEQGIPLARTIVDWRQLTKLIGTYTDSAARAHERAHGRIHTTYSQHSVLTGRLSSNDPNLQNIPVRTEDGRKIRTAFVAAPGPDADLGRLFARSSCACSPISPTSRR